MSSAAPVAAKHRHIFEVVRNRIQSGDYRPGDRIPSETNLIEEFGETALWEELKVFANELADQGHR